MDTKKIITTFKDKQLLQAAFTHRSFLNEAKLPVESNERLEFLGDAVLEIIISEYLFRTYPGYPEGKLTLLRSSIVRTETLANAARSLDLGSYLRLSKGEEDNNGRDSVSILANTYEAFLGALYLDQGIKAAQRLVKHTLIPLVDRVVKTKSYRDPKSYLQELVQDQQKITPEYRVLQEEGPDHRKRFTIGVYVNNNQIGIGKGKSKQEAEINAAEEALKKFVNG